MKKYLTANNIILALMAIGMIILFIALFSKSNVDLEKLEKKLKDQEKEILNLYEQQKQNVADDLKRDSILKHELLVSDKERETKIYYINKNRDEKINRISNFNNDSIRNAFAN